MKKLKDIIKQLDFIRTSIERNDFDSAIRENGILRNEIQKKLELIEAEEIADALIGNEYKYELLTSDESLIIVHQRAKEFGIKNFMDISKGELIKKINCRILLMEP